MDRGFTVFVLVIYKSFQTWA